MPGAAWPWKNTWSPDSPWSLPWKKWLNPTSYRLAADAEPGPVRPGHHHGRVPPDVGADAALDVLVAGEPGLALRRDRVDVVGATQDGHADLLLAGALQQPEHDVPGPPAAAGADHAVEGFHPFTGLVWVDVGQLGRQPVADDGVTLASGGHGVPSPSVLGARRSAASCDLCCPDQSWYLRAGNASLPAGNSRHGARGGAPGEAAAAGHLGWPFT